MTRQTKMGDSKLSLKGEELKVGDKLSFQAVDKDMNAFNLDEIKEDIKFISVVPSLDTGVCSLQTQRFNEEAKKYEGKVRFITLSKDLPFAADRFSKENSIENQTLVSDYNKGEFGEKSGFLINELNLLNRGIIILNKDNVVEYVAYNEQNTDPVDFDKALEKLDELVK